MILYYVIFQLRRSDPCILSNWVTADAYKQAFPSQPGKAQKAMHSRYRFVRLGIGMHVTSHMFNLSQELMCFGEIK